MAVRSLTGTASTTRLAGPASSASASSAAPASLSCSVTGPPLTVMLPSLPE